MQTSTLVVLACVLAVVVAANYEHQPALDSAYESVYSAPAHDSSPRTKRGLLLLKKKLLLGVLGLKAAKVGAVGAAGAAGALALKGKAIKGHKGPETIIEVHSKAHHVHHAHHAHHVNVPHSVVDVHNWSG